MKKKIKKMINDKMLLLTNCYEHIKIDKTEQDWSFNQFTVNASEFSA